MTSTGVTYNHQNGQFWQLNFTGKELDPETGYSYFGARYLESALTSLWLSVDPMADKYPSISPYAYCAWNPVKLVDPDGREGVVIINKSSKTITIRATYYVITTPLSKNKDDAYTNEDVLSMQSRINSLLNNKYSYEYEGTTYDVSFELGFVDAGNAEQALTMAEKDSWGNVLEKMPASFDNETFKEQETGAGIITHIGGVTKDHSQIVLNSQFSTDRNLIHEIFHTLYFNNDGAESGIGNYVPGQDMPTQNDINMLLNNTPLPIIYE